MDFALWGPSILVDDRKFRVKLTRWDPSMLQDDHPDRGQHASRSIGACKTTRPPPVQVEESPEAVQPPIVAVSSGGEIQALASRIDAVESHITAAHSDP